MSKAPKAKFKTPEVKVVKLSKIDVNPGLWTKAVIIANQYGAKPNDLVIVSPTKVEFFVTGK